MAFVVAPDGTRLWYEVVGTGPTVFLHLGAGCDSDLWRAAGYVDRLAAEFQVILYDHRGHGKTDRPRGAANNTLALFSGDVIAVLDAVGVERCAFWGYSRGIDTGIRLSIEHPDLIWALVGSGTIGGPTSPERPAVLRSRFEASGWEWMISSFDEEEREPVPAWFKDRIRATDSGQYTDFVEALATDGWNAAAEVPHVTVPSMFLTGELEDPDDETASDIAPMPDARRIRVPGLGHINAYAHSELVIDDVLAFLRQHEPER